MIRVRVLSGFVISTQPLRPACELRRWSCIPCGCKWQRSRGHPSNRAKRGGRAAQSRRARLPGVHPRHGMGRVDATAIASLPATFPHRLHSICLRVVCARCCRFKARSESVGFFFSLEGVTAAPGYLFPAQGLGWDERRLAHQLGHALARSRRIQRHGEPRHYRQVRLCGRCACRRPVEAPSV